MRIYVSATRFWLFIDGVMSVHSLQRFHSVGRNYFFVGQNFFFVGRNFIFVGRNG